MFLNYALILFHLTITLALKPNFVVILTDDQDVLLDGLKPMQRTLKYIANNGVTFENAFANTPICCPSRSTILTGKYAHNIKVFNNSLAGNCSSKHWQTHHENSTIFSTMKNENYTTFYAGKYLNQYGSKSAGGTKHVPKGHDWWLGLKGNSKYYDYTLSINGTAQHFTKEYLTDVIGKYAIDFLNVNYEKPFFMMLAPPASHAPFTPAERHRNAFLNVTAKRTPSFNYTSDGKHWIVSKPPSFLPSNITILDEIQRKRQQTLLSVDEMVAEIYLKTKKLGINHNTYFIFTSDNGYHIGQFGQPWDKRQPYETDIRIPLMVSGPGVSQKKISRRHVSLVDLAPTILNLAYIKIPDTMDGVSFKNELENPGDEYGGLIFVEYWGEGDAKTIDERCEDKSPDMAECSKESWCKCQDSRNNTYTCVVDLSNEKSLKFCQFFDDDDFVEVYDLNKDPYELHNILKNELKHEIYFRSLLADFKKM